MCSQLPDVVKRKPTKQLDKQLESDMFIRGGNKMRDTSLRGTKPDREVSDVKSGRDNLNLE